MPGVTQRKEFSAEKLLRQRRQQAGGADDAPPVLAGAVDNTEVLAAIEALRTEVSDLKSVLRDNDVIGPEDSEMAKDVRIEIAQMVRVIAKTKMEIAQIKHPDNEDDQFEKAHSELDEIVLATESATQSILAATEQIEAIMSAVAGMAHEDQEIIETIDRANDQLTLILEACNFQDITGQRITKVLKTVRFIEDRILAMISIWGVQAFEDLPVPTSDDEEAGEESLLQGPQSGNEGITQAEIDALFD